jgi:hypothetical protein
MRRPTRLISRVVPAGLLAVSLLVCGACGSSTPTAVRTETISTAANTHNLSAKQPDLSTIKQEVEHFVANRKQETRLAVAIPGGLRESVYVGNSRGRVCVGIQAFVPGTPLADMPARSDTCGSSSQQTNVFVVGGSGRTGNILNIAGSSDCRQPVMPTSPGHSREACITQPFPYRLVVLPQVSMVKLHNAGWLHTIRPGSFHCSPSSGTCFLDLLPNGTAQ